MKKLIIIVLAAFVFFGCQDKKETTNTTKQQEVMKKAPENVVAEKEGIQITNAWVRPAAKNRNTGMFFNVVNNSKNKVTLFKAKSDIAEQTQIHETFKKSNDMMGMREVEYVVVEPGKTFEFKPMNFHVMLINTNKDLVAGDEVELTLVYDNNEEITFKAKVKDNMPSIRAAEEKDVQM